MRSDAEVNRFEAPVLSGKRAAVLLYSYYPADPRPRRAAEALVEAGMAVELFCLRESPDEPSNETIGGVTITRFGSKHRRGGKLTYFLQYFSFLTAAFLWLSGRVIRQTYDLVHVHNMPDVLVFSAWFAKLRGSKVILDLHDPMPELMRSIFELPEKHWCVRLLKLVERWSIGFADLVLTPNITFKELFVSRGAPESKVHIVMNSPREDIFDPALYEDPAPKQAEVFSIMHHGSIVHRHGIDLLVEAVALLRQKIPGVRLDIYGSATPFKDEVLALAKTRGIEGIVHYHGAMDQRKIAQAILQCDVGVVPNRRSSFTELNFPTRIFEYLAMERPVVVPSTLGIQDYFESAELSFFEPGNVQDLAAQIFEIRRNPEQAGDRMRRGIAVYRQHCWAGEKARYVDDVVTLLNPLEPVAVYAS